MTVGRTLPNLSSDPAGIGGGVWTDFAADSVAALWGFHGGVLQSVEGTNAITATLLVSTGFAALADSQEFELIPTASNTGPVTLNVQSIGFKSIVDQDGGALTGAELLLGRATTLKFFADDDHFRIMGAGGDTYVTITGGLQLQRSAPARAAADVAATTALTALVSVNLQMQATTNRVIIEGNVSRLVGAGSQDTDGTVIALYVDGVEVETFTDWCEPAMFMSTPFAFEYFPGDVTSHTYQIRASSTVEATYPAKSNWVVASEMSPNS